MSQSSIGFRLPSGADWNNPFDMYARLRKHAPVWHVHDDDTDYWVLTRHADVRTAAADPVTFSSGSGLTVGYGELKAIGMAETPPMVMQDPPAHTEFRSLVARGFTPRQVTAIEPRVREFVTDRLGRMAGEAEPDIVGELLKPLPSMVVAHYLGVPEEDWPQFDAWTAAIVGAVSSGGPVTGDGPEATAANAATAELLAYFGGLIEFRRDHPADDTVSQLVAADSPADIVAILAFVFTMVAGGNDTTTGLLGGSLPLLYQAPGQRQRLVDDPGLIPGAVEELLRLTSPVQGLARMTTRPVAYDTPHGPVEIPAGRKVLLCYAAANRDPAVYGDDAESLDIERRPRNLLTFSHGHHHCLGAAAARMQARVALGEILARFPDFEVDADGIVWADGNYVRRPLFVPFRTGQRR
ncbi:cytochrome P450 [Gordonia sinesedis]